jgi:hypothetical protein
MTQDPTTLTTTPKDDVQRLAHAVREACIRAAVDGYEQGGISELCAEGRSSWLSTHYGLSTSTASAWL